MPRGLVEHEDGHQKGGDVRAGCGSGWWDRECAQCLANGMCQLSWPEGVSEAQEDGSSLEISWKA
jgi:hypothetical protein